jgi:hypothetical protein
MGGFTEEAGPQAGGPAHISDMTRRLAELEVKNIALLARLIGVEARSQAPVTGPIGPTQTI